MGFSMISRLPSRKERLTISGIATEAFRRFLLDVAENSNPPQEFGTLADIQTAYPNPPSDLYIMVSGQGLARYNKTLFQWVLAADDQTPIT